MVGFTEIFCYFLVTKIERFIKCFKSIFNMKSDDNQPSLFPQEQIKLEDRLPRTVNDYPNFGFLEENLISFTFPQEIVQAVDQEFSAAQHLHDGMRDLERSDGLPIEIYLYQNTAETAGLFVGNSVAKKFPNISFVKGKSYNDMLKEERVEEIISALVRIGYSYGAVQQMKNKGFIGHSTEYGHLKKRMASLSTDAKEKFLKKFRMKRAVSDRENKHKFDFMDLNLAGKVLGYNTHQTADGYVHLVIPHMKSAYERYFASR